MIVIQCIKLQASDKYFLSLKPSQREGSKTGVFFFILKHRFV